MGKSRTEAWREAISRLLDGYPVGSAMESFNSPIPRVTIPNGLISSQSEQSGEKVDSESYRMTQRGMISARNYIILGDPAVRMMVADDEGDIRNRV